MLNKKAQSVAEYAIFISMMIAAIATIQLYIKRGLQARYADGTDQIVTNLADPALWLKTSWPGSVDISTNPVTITTGKQYEPYGIDSRKTQWVKEDKLNYNMAIGGNVTRDIITRTENQVTDYVRYDY